MKQTSGALVGDYFVPVVRANFTTSVQFSGGEHGRKEAGDFCFWTAVVKRPKIINGKKRRLILGRALACLSPGDRFDRMAREMITAKTADDRDAYKVYFVSLLERGRNISYIRPSTRKEVDKWMRSHGKDEPFAYRISIGGRIVMERERV